MPMDMTAEDNRSVFAQSVDSLVEARAVLRRKLVRLRDMPRGVEDASRNLIKETLDLLVDVNPLDIAVDQNPELAAELLLSGYASLDSLTKTLEDPRELRAELETYLKRVSFMPLYLTGTTGHIHRGTSYWQAKLTWTVGLSRSVFDGLCKRIGPQFFNLPGVDGVADYITRNGTLCSDSACWDQDVIAWIKSWGTSSQGPLHWKEEVRRQGVIEKIAAQPLSLFNGWLTDQEESAPSIGPALSRSEMEEILTFTANAQRIVLSRGENLPRNIDTIIECQKELTSIWVGRLERDFLKGESAFGAYSLGPCDPRMLLLRG